MPDSAMTAQTVSSSATGRNLFLARQPILDRDQRIIGYELLYRRGQTESVQIEDGNQASLQLLAAAFLDFGIESLVHDLPAFVNVTAELLDGSLLDLLPAGNLVLELSEPVVTDEAAAIRHFDKLRGMGYGISLDNVSLSEGRHGLLGHVDYIKLDLQSLSSDALARQVALLRPLPVKLVAMKVETHAQFQHCLELGFDGFQGYFFTRPEVLEKKRMPSGRLNALKLLSAVNDPDTSVNQLVDIVHQDAVLSYRVLRYLNSPLCGFQGSVTSLQHAVLLMGFSRLRQLSNLLVMTGIDDKPPSLMVTSLVRARMCEEVMTIRRRGDPEQAFTVGLLSSLDAVFDLSMEELLDSISLAPDLRRALVQGDGEYGVLLRCARAFETGDWGILDEVDIDAELLQQAYLNSVSWADRTFALYNRS